MVIHILCLYDAYFFFMYMHKVKFMYFVYVVVYIVKMKIGLNSKNLTKEKVAKNAITHFWLFHS